MRYWLIFLLCTSLAFAQEYPFDSTLYDAAQLTIRMDVSSSVTLQGSGSADKLEAIVYYVPEEAGKIDASPKPASMQPLVYSWRNVGAGEYPFRYSTTVQQSMDRPRITEKVTYPFSTPAQLTEYLQPQEITDTNREIQQKTQELTAGKTDSMEVVFALADWVHNNVEYNLSTLTAEASQPSSWVFRNRYGVCDEITSLFISMAREAGIPARFVSGIAYTNQFETNWGPHGWAEVWLPGVGWVPVDVTYGQVGYVDATHIVIKHSLDAKNTAVDYSLLSRGLSMRAAALDVDNAVIDRQGGVTETITVTAKPLYSSVGSNSANMITSTARNDADYYIATELYLATTQDTRVHEKQRQQVLLPPKSTREVSWRVTHSAFEKGYEYTIPFTVVSQRAGNATTSVYGSTSGKRYALPPGTIGVSSIHIDCENPPLLYVGEDTTVQCRAPGAELCGGRCSDSTLDIKFTANESGAFPQVITAEDKGQKGSAIVTFIVDENPRPRISATLPPQATFDDTLTLSFNVETSRLNNVTVEAAGKHFNNNWQVDELTSKGFELRFPATYLDAGENTITITVSGQDKNGNTVTGSTPLTTTLQASAWQQVHLFFLHLFL